MTINDMVLFTERVRALIPERDVKIIRMFGGQCFMINGNMLVCASQNGLMVRVGKDQHEEALQLPHARACRPAGRPMAGFIKIAPEGLETDEDLKLWVDMARAFVCGLPPKVKKEKKPKAATGKAEPFHL